MYLNLLWYGGWLNQNPDKIVIAPERWVNHLEDEKIDIIPENWIRISG